MAHLLIIDDWGRKDGMFLINSLFSCIGARPQKYLASGFCCWIISFFIEFEFETFKDSDRNNLFPDEYTIGFSKAFVWLTNGTVLKSITFIDESHRALVGGRIVVGNGRGLGTRCNIEPVDDRNRFEWIGYAWDGYDVRIFERVIG